MSLNTDTQWKKIPHYDYEVSDTGLVRGKYNKKPTKIHNTKNSVYSYVKLSRHGKSKRFSVHRLVATAFIPNPDDKPQVNHIDSDRSNNVVTNLEWCTAKENTQHSITHGFRGPKKTT